MTVKEGKLPMYGMPTGVPAQAHPGPPLRRRLLRFVLTAVLSVTVVQYLGLVAQLSGNDRGEVVNVPLRAQEYLDKCQLLNVKPGPPADFHTRTHSDRFVPGTQPTLILVRLSSGMVPR